MDDSFTLDSVAGLQPDHVKSNEVAAKIDSLFSSLEDTAPTPVVVRPNQQIFSHTLDYPPSAAAYDSARHAGRTGLTPPLGGGHIPVVAVKLEQPVPVPTNHTITSRPGVSGQRPTNIMSAPKVGPAGIVPTPRLLSGRSAVNTAAASAATTSLTAVARNGAGFRTSVKELEDRSRAGFRNGSVAAVGGRGPYQQQQASSSLAGDRVGPEYSSPVKSSTLAPSLSPQTSSTRGGGSAVGAPVPDPNKLPLLQKLATMLQQAKK
jgi:hypothetical protein